MKKFILIILLLLVVILPIQIYAGQVSIGSTFIDTIGGITLTEPDTLYLSSWQYDSVNGWSVRKTGYKIFYGAGASPDSSGSFIVMGGPGVDEQTYIDESRPTYNYGNNWDIVVGNNYTSQSADIHYEKRGLFRFVDLDDSIAAYSGVTFDSGRLFISFEYVTLTTNDSMALDLYQVTTGGWIEGTGEGSASGGATWGQYSTGNNWASVGGDFSATREGADQDTVWVIGGVTAVNDTISLFVTGATISDSMNNGAGLLLKYYDLNMAGSNAIHVSIYSDRQSNIRPYLKVYYSVGEAPSAIINLRTRRAVIE